jgi:outer membrane receptor protein involved in Fe transport
MPVRLRLFILLGLTLAAAPVRAQDRGTLSGRVTDKRTGHAIPFASVSVPDAKRGGLTDSEGQFVIPGVPPGTWEVRVQFLGYGPESRPGVVVTAGRATSVNFQLSEVIVHEMKTVEVTAERRLVDVKQGTTVRSVNAGEIRNLPVQTISEVLQQQAGVSTENDQIHIRGGRADETIFVVNGVTNRDLVTGQSTAGQINARSVQEVNVATGAYDVRYGNALSGVVEIKLKEGGDAFSGGLTTSSGTYGARAFQLVLSGPDPVIGRFGQLVHLPGTVSSILDVSGNLFDTRYLSDGTGLFQHTFSPWKRTRLRSSYEDSFFGKRFHYGDMWSPAEDNRWDARYGLVWKPNVRDKVNMSFSKRIAIDQGFSRTFLNATGDAGDPAFPWQWDHRVDHAPTIFEDNVQSSVEWRRTLSTTGFTTLQLSRFFFARRTDVQGKMWNQFERPRDRAIYPDGDPRRDDFFFDSGDNSQWQDLRNTNTAIKWSLTQRPGRHHELELGIDHDFQSVQLVDIEYPWDTDPDSLGSTHDIWKVHPWVGDAYVRDRIDYEGFVGNLGLRTEWWFAGQEAEKALADTANFNITPETRNEFYQDTRSFFGRRYKLRISPRVSVSHPITENSNFFFNYGEFTQNPSGIYVYSKLGSISSEGFPLLGNPNLNPEVQVNYEVGGKYEFMKDMAINTTFFLKDAYDYPTATKFTPSQGRSLNTFFVYLNGHFSRSRGFEVVLEKRRSRWLSSKVTYTYGQSKGKSSDPAEQRVVAENGGDAAETRLSETYVSWNRPHKVAVSLDARFEDKPPESLPWLRQLGFNAYVQGQSGRAYTPVGVTLDPTGGPNSKNGPFQITADVRLNRWFKWMGRRYDLSLSGTNIFANHIINRIDPMTGLGRVWNKGSYDLENPNTDVGKDMVLMREAQQKMQEDELLLQATTDPVEQGRLRADIRKQLDTIALQRLNIEYIHVGSIMDPSNYGPGAQYRLQLDVDF